MAESRSNDSQLYKRLLGHAHWHSGPIILALIASLGMSACAKAGEPSSTQQTFDPHDVSGIWKVTNFVGSTRPLEERITHTLEGEPVPLQPWAQKIYDQRLAIARGGQRAFADTESYCLPGGIPRLMRGPNYPMQILQTPGQITIIFEALNTIRFIYMDAQHPTGDDLDINWMGDSTATWDGDTLAIDTVGLNDKTQIDKLGLPHSDAIHVVERLRRTGPDSMENIITIDDPKAYTRPWKVKATYARAPKGTRIMEYVCNENNRNIPDADGTVGN